MQIGSVAGPRRVPGGVSELIYDQFRPTFSENKEKLYLEKVKIPGIGL